MEFQHVDVPQSGSMMKSIHSYILINASSLNGILDYKEKVSSESVSHSILVKQFITGAYPEAPVSQRQHSRGSTCDDGNSQRKGLLTAS